MSTAEQASECPMHGRSDSKTAAFTAKHLVVDEGQQRIRSFERAREILLSKSLLQAGAGAASFDTSDPDASPVFYLDGEPHKLKRSNLARFFTPKAVTSRYHPIIEREVGRLLAQLQRDGRAPLDIISFELAVAVVANIVGLTDSDLSKMSRRLSTLLSAGLQRSLLGRITNGVRRAVAAATFYRRDITPALRSRKDDPQDDILSSLIAKGASRKMILIECMTYAAAGMVTTREFIVMAAWHLLERDELRADYLAGDEDRQFAILLEILRLEPVAALLTRRTAPAESGPEAGAEDTTYALDIRAIHLDEEAVGPCPHELDPDRATRLKKNGAFLSFGAGAHVCPGRYIALHEARMFLDALLRLPGIRLERAPDMGWSDLLLGYEMRNSWVACDRAG